MKAARLINGVEYNQKNPETFSIPHKETRETLVRGWFAKIGMETAEGFGERFWVRVVGKNVDGDYVGSVNNNLQVINLELGEHVAFGPEHVLDVLPPKETDA